MKQASVVDAIVCPLGRRMSRPEEFVITRRRLLWLPALAFAPAWLGGRLARARPSLESTHPLSLDAFVHDAQPLARELVRDRSRAGQDAYLYRLAALAVRLGAVPERALFPLGDLAPGVQLAPAFRGVPFFVIEWRLAPGARLPAHDHPGYSVCTVGLEGEAEVEHYEATNEAQTQVRRTRATVLEAGRVDTLSAYRDNIHEFRAGKRGARGLDITTLHADADSGFHWIDVTQSPGPLGVPLGARFRPAGRS